MEIKSYPVGGGFRYDGWLSDSATSPKLAFTSQSALSFDEAAGVFRAMASKIDFANELKAVAVGLGKAMDAAPDLYQKYFDLGYNSGGASELTDEDVASLGLTAAQVVSAITLLENYNKFVSGTDPASSVYRITINQVRG